MAANRGDRLDQLRAALEDVGYAEFLADFEAQDEPREVTIDRLTAALRDAVAPAIRARAASIRLLARAEIADVEPFQENEFQEPDQVRVPLDRSEADRLESLADELERVVTYLRQEQDADGG